LVVQLKSFDMTTGVISLFSSLSQQRKCSVTHTERQGEAHTHKQYNPMGRHSLNAR